MPKKNDSKRVKAKWAGYLNYNPDEEDRREIREKVYSAGKALSRLQELADNGYRVSIKHDHYRDTQVLEIYAQWSDMANAGRTLVVAHDDVLVSATAVDHFLSQFDPNEEWPSQRRTDNPYSW